MLKMFEHFKPACISIQKGQCKSRQHDQYKLGMKARQTLSLQINSMHVFSHEAHEVAENWLQKEFCVDGNPRQLDYALRVLQMELFIRIFMHLTHVSYENAEREMIAMGMNEKKSQI